jgi:hypothetical protein
MKNLHDSEGVNRAYEDIKGPSQLQLKTVRSVRTDEAYTVV